MSEDILRGQKWQVVSPLQWIMYNRAISLSLTDAHATTCNSFLRYEKKKILGAHLGIHLKIIVKTFGGREEGITHLSKIIWFLRLCFIWSLFHNWLWVCIRHLHHAWWYKSFIKDWQGKKSDPPYTVLKKDVTQRTILCFVVVSSSAIAWLLSDV